MEPVTASDPPAGATAPGGAVAATGPVGAELDARDRPLRDLRVSVTDRCNFRCRYCMPREAFGERARFLPDAQVLGFDEVTRVVRAAAALGVRKVRLTGGEPLLRPRLPELVAALAAVEGIEDLALTTNGSLLADHAAALRAAGLHRVTVSLDALDEPTFRAVSDTTVPLGRVLDGLAAARAAGLAPVKLNAVVRRGVNEHAVTELAAYARAHGDTVRFVEYMDVGTTNGWRRSDVVPADRILARLHERWPLEPVVGDPPGAAAERYRYRDGGGEVGVVASVTRPFCRTCVRARLSADGSLFTCLFAVRGHDLRPLLRSGAGDAALRQRLAGIWRVRDDRYSELRSAEAGGEGGRAEMSYLGG